MQEGACRKMDSRGWGEMSAIGWGADYKLCLFDILVCASATNFSFSVSYREATCMSNQPSMLPAR